MEVTIIQVSTLTFVLHKLPHVSIQIEVSRLQVINLPPCITLCGPARQSCHMTVCWHNIQEILDKHRSPTLSCDDVNTSHQRTRTWYTAKVWQARIDLYDQYVRRILAIRELNDVPIEIWRELCIDPATYKHGRAPVNVELQKLIGQHDKHNEAVEIAVTHYVAEHAKLVGLTDEAAKLKIEEIVAKELTSTVEGVKEESPVCRAPPSCDFHTP